MMRFSLKLSTGAVAISLLLAGRALCEDKPDPINFSVRKALTSVEGPDIQQSYISQGDQKIGFRVPKTCTIESSADALTLRPIEFASAAIMVRMSPLEPAERFSKETIEAMSKQVRSDIPAGATFVDEDTLLMDVYPVNGWKSAQFLTTYQKYGQSMRRAVTFVNLDAQTQIEVTVHAPFARFDEIDQMANRFMISWFSFRENERTKPVLN